MKPKRKKSGDPAVRVQRRVRPSVLRWKDMVTDPKTQYSSEIGYAGKNRVAQIAYSSVPEIMVWARDRNVRFECSEVNLAKRLAASAYAVLSERPNSQSSATGADAK